MSKEVLSLFSGYGIELEYMIVDQHSLNVKPICDRVMYTVSGDYLPEVDFPDIGWSNELALHVIEFKTNGPSPTLPALVSQFQTHVRKVNSILNEFSACLLPGAAHPWMDPQQEFNLWPHEYNPIYEAYNRIFDCHGHGWTNLQSAHLNLPFANDEEFARLHTAIRLLLPIIPALSASTPILEGKNTGYIDTRLTFYGKNQEKVPSISGHIIPESVLSEAEYEEKILQRIYRDIAPFDPQGILQYEWLNSRGAIARFDRHAIEIRIVDVQEAPVMDLAIAAGVVATLQALTEEQWASFKKQLAWTEQELLDIYLQVIKHGLQAQIPANYLKLFGVQKSTATARDLWSQLLEEVSFKATVADTNLQRYLEKILQQGNLAERILKGLNNDFSAAQLQTIYRQLAECLQNGDMFTP